MRGVVVRAPGDVRVDERDDPTILEPTDAIIRVTAACICGSDLWPYRCIEKPEWPQPMGHESVGIVEQIGDEVRSVKVGDFVVGSTFASDNTCQICRSGYQSRCVHAVPRGSIGTQAEYVRVPLADGTLVATRTQPTPEQIPHLLDASDVLGTGWFAAIAPRPARGRPSQSSETARWDCSPFSPPNTSVRNASSPGADTPTVKPWPESSVPPTSSPSDGVAKIKELTEGLGAHSVIEPVGTQESMMQAIRSTRPGGHVGYVGVAHEVELPGMDLFFSGVHPHGGPAPVRRFLPELIELIINGQIDPGEVFDLTLPLEQAAEATKRWMSAA